MNHPIISEILYLTHDKWANQTKIKYREEFKEILLLWLEYKPEIIQDLEYIVEYGENDKGLVIMVGVLKLLKHKYPDEYKNIKIRHITKNMKQILREESKDNGEE